MAYVPPALRKKNTASSDSPRDRLEPTALVRESAAEEDCVLSIENIQDHFWPRQYLDSDNSEEDGAELQEQTKGRGYNPYLNAVHKHSTLNGTAQEPDKLGYLLLFRGANPRWTKDKVIFAKTNLGLLQKKPTIKTDTSPAALADSELEIAERTSDLSTAPIEQDKANPAKTASSQTTTTPIDLPAGPVLVFEEKNQGHHGIFTFGGYYTLTNLELLEPNSPPLVRMLDQKWTITNGRGFSRQKQRDPDGWKRSLNQRWAVLKFEKDEKSTAELPAPQIGSSIPNPSKPLRTQTVNEMLQEMRLKDKKEADLATKGDDERPSKKEDTQTSEIEWARDLEIPED